MFGRIILEVMSLMLKKIDGQNLHACIPYLACKIGSALMSMAWPAEHSNFMTGWPSFILHIGNIL